MAAPVLVLYRVITECLFGYEIQAAATIGRRFTIHHGYAVVINKHVVAGDDFTIRHGVTIGNRGADSLACPVIGHGVELGRMSSCLAILLSVITSRLARVAWCLTVFRTMRWWWEKSTGEGQHMNILQFNVRLAEGGAAGVALISICGRCKRADVTFCLRLW